LRNKPAGDGFVSGSMRGGEIGRPLLFAGNLALRLPGVNRLATRLGERRVGGGNVLLPAFDLTDWHDFCLDWNGSGAHFAIDGIMVATFEPTEIPTGPLGFVAWIDTNWTRLDADGRYQGGRLAAPGQQWLDLARVAITHGIVGPHRLSVAHR
jgi:hypothetical protein